MRKDNGAPADLAGITDLDALRILVFQVDLVANENVAAHCNAPPSMRAGRRLTLPGRARAALCSTRFSIRRSKGLVTASAMTRNLV